MITKQTTYNIICMFCIISQKFNFHRTHNIIYFIFFFYITAVHKLYHFNDLDMVRFTFCDDVSVFPEFLLFISSFNCDDDFNSTKSLKRMI